MARLEAAAVELLGSTLSLFTMAEARLLTGGEITIFLLGGASLVTAAVGLVMQHPRAQGDQRGRSAA